MTDLPPVRIQLVANGIENIKNAFQSIEQSAKKLEESLVRTRRSGATKRNTETKREEQERTRITDAEGKKREAAQEREFRNLARQAEKWRREEIAAEKRKNAQLEAEAKRSASARERFFSKVTSKVANAGNRVMSLAGTVAAVGGGVGIVDSLGQAAKNQGKAREISLNSRGEISKQQAYSSAQALSTKGFTTEESLDAIDKFVAKSGDTKMAIGILDELGDMANATGAKLEDLSVMAAMAWNSMTDAEKKSVGKEGLLKTMRTQIGQGRAGAVDIRELGQYGPRVFNTAAQFKGGVTGNQEFIGALVQNAIKTGTATDAAEATESAKSFYTDLSTHKKKFEKHGITNIMDKNENLLDARTIFERIMVGTQGKLNTLHEIGMERQSLKTLEGPAKAYRDALATSKAKTPEGRHQEAMNAALKLLDPFMKVEESAATIKKQAAEREAEADKQLTAKFNALRDAVGDKLLPELIKVIPKIAELTPQIVKLLEKLIGLADWVARNPLQGAFIAVAALIAKEAAVAFAADSLKKMFTANMGGAGVGGAPGASGVGFNMGTVGAVTMGAVAGITIGNMMTGGLDDLSKKRGQERGDRTKEINDTYFALAGNKPGSEEAAKALIQKIKDESSGGSKEYGKWKDEASELMMADKPMAALWSTLDFIRPKKVGPTEEEQKVIDALEKQMEENKKNTKHTQENTDAMKQLTVAINNVKLESGPLKTQKEVHDIFERVFGGNPPKSPSNAPGK